jgi:hypothetical protein
VVLPLLSTSSLPPSLNKLITTFAESTNEALPSLSKHMAGKSPGLDLYTPFSMTIPIGTPVCIAKKSAFDIASTFKPCSSAKAWIAEILVTPKTLSPLINIGYASPCPVILTAKLSVRPKVECHDIVLMYSRLSASSRVSVYTMVPHAYATVEDSIDSIISMATESFIALRIIKCLLYINPHTLREACAYAR